MIEMCDWFVWFEIICVYDSSVNDFENYFYYFDDCNLKVFLFFKGI